jgi:hypothetical protein
MLEVHSGSKPGRPRLLLICAAGVLVGTLGLAWWQAHDRRALGDEVRIEGTPLVVRPPRGWRQDPHTPGIFALPAEEERTGHAEVTLERYVWFQYVRIATFVPPEEILKWRNLQEWAKSTAPEPARVGPLGGIQVRRIVRHVAFGRVYLQEQVLRVACSPHGDVITVEYVPLTGLAVAQLELLDDICAAIRLEDPAFTAKPAELLRHAGITAPEDESWEVFGPDFPEVPGFYVQSCVDGMPAWSLGVFRTWLADGRTPADLLVDFGSLHWGLAPENAHVAESRREDGARIAAMRHPAFGRSDHRVASVWLVAESAEQAALIFVFSGAGSAEAADEAARKLAQALTCGPTEALPPLEASAAAGRELADMLTQKGAVPWWGRLPVETYYVEPAKEDPRGVYIGRAPIGDDPAVGYRGHTLYLPNTAGEPGPPLKRWTIDGHARGYAHRFQGDIDTWQGRVPATVGERLDAGSGAVRRTAKTAGQHRSWEFSVGPSFVCPPLVSIAEAWVAQRDQGAWLIEATSHFEAGTHTALLRPLPPDQSGHRRLLTMTDYWPRGTVLGFDDGPEPLYMRCPAEDYQRVTEKEAVTRLPILPRLRHGLRQQLLEPPG